MNLNSAVYDNVLAIDQRLQMLEQEVQSMDQQFGFVGRSQYSQELEQQPIQSKEQIQPTLNPNQNLTSQQRTVHFDESTQSKQQNTSHSKGKSQNQQQQSRYQNLLPVQMDTKSIQVQKIKPQISKEYASTLAIGRPDLSVLEQEFELGDKFYEPQYKNEDVNIRFRETESQIKHENTIMRDILKSEATQFYDSFM